MIKANRNRAFLLLVGLILCHAGITQVTGKPDIARIYEDAEKLYRVGNYTASLDYLKKESGDWIGMSDTLMYMKIKNLDNLYRTDYNHTKDLESTLQRFFSRVNKNTFPELKYSEVTAIYTTFQSFREKDKAFHDSVSRVMDLNKTASLAPIRQVTSDYLKAYPNTYFSTELNGYINSINDKLNQLEIVRKKRVKDSLNKDALKQVGKMLILNLSYSVPSGGTGTFAGINNYNDAVNFYNGKYTGSLGEKYSLNASLAEAFINIYTGSTAKFGLNWSLFDAEYTVFDWGANSSFMSEKQTTDKRITQLKSIKAGTRIGPIITILASKSVAVSFYYSARPGVQFLTGKAYFDVPNGSLIKTYEVEPVLTNYNFSSEVGMKFYFFKKVFVSPYFHFGRFNWKNNINDVSTGAAGSKQSVQADYEFKFIGLRIGF